MDCPGWRCHLGGRDGGTTKTEPWLQTTADETFPTLSPDGRWPACASIESGQPTRQVYVQPFTGPGGRTQVSNAGGWAPMWSPDGNELFYVNSCPGKQATCLFVSTVRVGATVEPGRPRQLLELPDYADSAPLRSYDSADGRRFIYLHVRALDMPVPPPPTQMHVVLNWFEELKAKVPAHRQGASAGWA